MSHPLLQFAASDIQFMLVQDVHVLGQSVYKVAKNRNIDYSNLKRANASLLRRAAAGGYSPDHDWHHPVPDGHKIKGVSTFYNEEGHPVRQWVKSQTDEQRQFEILIERLENAMEGLKPFKPTKPPKTCDDNLLTLLTITDFHLGMYAWQAETGDDWDMKIARDVFLNSIHDMIQKSPNSGTGMLCQLGDFLHWDGILSASTPISGHAVDADSRYGKLVEMAMSVMTEAVKMMLKKFGKVVVVSAEGNHDISGSIWLRKHIKQLFKDEPRLEVVDNEFPYYAYLHGDTMLAFHHGHKKKMEQLHKLFCSEPRFREMWGKSTYTYMHSGHLHSERLVEDSGYISERHPTLSSRDAYASRGGWVSRRGAKVITYDAVDGEVARITVRPRL